MDLSQFPKEMPHEECCVVDHKAEETSQILPFPVQCCELRRQMVDKPFCKPQSKFKQVMVGGVIPNNFEQGYNMCTKIFVINLSSMGDFQGGIYRMTANNIRSMTPMMKRREYPRNLLYVSSRSDDSDTLSSPVTQCAICLQLTDVKLYQRWY